MKFQYDRYETVYETEICDTAIEIIYWEYIGAGYEFKLNGGDATDWGHGDAIAALISAYVGACSMALDCQAQPVWIVEFMGYTITINLVEIAGLTFYEFMIDERLIDAQEFATSEQALDAAYRYVAEIHND